MRVGGGLLLIQQKTSTATVYRSPGPRFLTSQSLSQTLSAVFGPQQLTRCP